MVSLSQRASQLAQSDIRALSVECDEIGGINLGQGICDLPVDDAIKQSAYQAISHNHSIYAPSYGIKPLRQAICQKACSFNQFTGLTSANVMVTHGATGAYVAAVYTLFDPGDRVILFEPFYGYHKNLLNFLGIEVDTVHFSPETFSINMAHLENIITSETKGIVICTPNNPTGKVFDENELTHIAQVAKKNELAIVTDEIYEYITYPGYTHYSIGSDPRFFDRTITLSGFSKTYNMTGWRLGYMIGPEHIINQAAHVHDMFYVCAVTPLQYAVIQALELPDNYYDQMRQYYLKQRDMVTKELKALGFEFKTPQGAYYIFAKIPEATRRQSNRQLVKRLLHQGHVATVPGQSFFNHPEDGNQYIRICYALNESKLAKAMEGFKYTLG